MLLVRIGIAARLLGVCTRTLHRWETAGRIKAARTPGGHRRYDAAELRDMAAAGRKADHEDRETPNIDPVGGPRAVTYTRVSSTRQAAGGDLDRQKTDLREYCEKKGYTIAGEYSDIASGLNDARPNLLRLVKTVAAGLCEVVVVRDADRLARFGTRIMEEMFPAEGVRLEVAFRSTASSTREELLVQDVVALLTSFSGKLHRARRGRKLAAE
jgi:predicted site-specific integrase-resolvase